MKLKHTNYINIASCALIGLMVVGCAEHRRQHALYTPMPPWAYGPTYVTYEENGVRYSKGSMSLPAGTWETNALLIEKTVPAEVLVGQKFDYDYKVSNLSDSPLHMVTVSDRVSPNFVASQAEPNATSIREGVASWQLGDLQAKETKIIRVKGASLEEGAINTCGWATSTPVLCQDIRVVKANLNLTRNAPAEAVICDPIPMSITVKNTGSSVLTHVIVTDPLPEGLTSEGKSSLTFDAGKLAPGESREFTFNAIASKTGKYDNKSQATCTQGVEVEAATATIVREPVLNITCTGPQQFYIGRPFDIALTVLNKGDTAAAGTVLELPIPAGLAFQTASANGQASGNKVIWDLGSLPVNGSQQLSATFMGQGSGTFEFAPSVKGTCAKLVAATSQTRVMGLAGILLEKADNIDPVGVNETSTYTVKVTNQGSADDNNVHVVVKIAPELVPVSATGEGTISGQTVTFPVVSHLAPKESVSYQIVVKGVKPGDGRTRFELTSDMLKDGALLADESTHVY